MKVSELLNYIQESINDSCLSLDSEVLIRDSWGDLSAVIELKNDTNKLVLADHEAT